MAQEMGKITVDSPIPYLLSDLTNMLQDEMGKLDKSTTSAPYMRIKTKIDELPQVLNIFKNEMSLIGPRPCLPVQEELIQARQALGVLSVKPGISGLAQINNIDMSDPELLARWDAKYIHLRSLLLDLKIFIATVLGRGQGDKVSVAAQ